MNKRWLLVPILVGVMTLAFFAGTALAETEGDSGDSPWSTFTSKVASILGLEEAEVQSALDQAREEMRDEALKARLDYQVTEGLITQAQADEYSEWYQSRPEGLSPGGRFGGRGFHMGGFKGMRGRFGGFGMQGPCWGVAPDTSAPDN